MIPGIEQRLAGDVGSTQRFRALMNFVRVLVYAQAAKFGGGEGWETKRCDLGFGGKKWTV